MPTLPQYQEQVNLSGGPLGPGPQGDTGAAAIGALGRDISQDIHRRQAYDLQVKEDNALVIANDEIQSARSSWSEQLEQRKQNAPAGGVDFAKKTLTDFDADAKERVGRAGTQRAREYMRERLAAVRLGIQEESQNFERDAGLRDRAQRIDKGLDSARTAVEFRPQDFDQVLGEQALAIAGSGLSDEQRVAAFDVAQKQIASAAVQGMIRRDPYAALADLNNEKSKTTSINALDFDDRQRLRNSAESEIRRLEAERDSKNTEARQAMNDRLRDIAAASALGIPITDTPDEATLQALYGKHEGSQRYQAVQRAATLSTEVSKMNGMSTSELLKSAATAQPKQVEGAADQAQLAGFVNNRTEAIIDAREKDGAGYLVKFAPATQEAWAKFINLPGDATPEERTGATDAYLRAVRADRERLQIPGKDVLPNGYVDAIADSINSSPTAEKLASTMEAEGLRWGSAWPQVYEQLAPKLSDTAAVIGSGIPRAAAVKLAATSSLTDAELKGLIPPGTKWKDVSDSVDGKLDDFERSFPATGARTFNAFRTSAERLAARYMHEGASQSDAVTKAYTDLIGSQYQMIEFRGTPMRVPSTMNGDDAERGASLALAGYSATNLDVRVPEGSAMPVEEYATQHSNYVRDNGYWMTNGSGTGISLYVDGGPVTSSGGKVERTWEQLRALVAIEDQRIADIYAKESVRRQLAR